MARLLLLQTKIKTESEECGNINTERDYPILLMLFVSFIMMPYS